MRVGKEANVIPLGAWGTRFVPDEHFSFLRQPGGTDRVWMAGGTSGTAGDTFAFETGDFATMTPLIRKGGAAVPVLRPNHPGSSAPDADYAGAGSVFVAKNGRDLILVYHGENHTFGGVHDAGTPFYATICLARSSDGGRSWKREGAIVTGMVPKPPGAPPRAALGAGQPAVVESHGYFYLLYMDWNLTYPDATYLARAPVSGDAAPGTWRKWDGARFSQPGIGGTSVPVLEAPAPAARNVWAGNPSVSYNAFYGAFIDVFQTARAFYFATSPDLVHWSTPIEIFAFGENEDAPVAGKPWYSYPTLVTPGSPNERETDRTGYIVYAKADWSVTPHTAYRRALTFY